MKNPPFVGTYGPVTSNGASGLVPNLRLSDGLPLPTPTDADNPSGTIIGVAQDFKNTRVQQFNLIAEKEFGGNVFSAGYVGSRGAHVAFVVPNLDLAPAGPARMQPRRKLFRAAARRDDDRPVRERLRVDLQRDAAGVPAPAPQRPDDRLQLRARAHACGRSRRRTTSTSSSASTPTSTSGTGSSSRPTTRCRSGSRSPAPPKQMLAGWQVNGVAYWQSGLAVQRHQFDRARQHQRRQRSAGPGRRSEPRQPDRRAVVQRGGVRAAGDQHDRQRAAQRAPRSAAAPPRPVVVQGRRR